MSSAPVPLDERRVVTVMSLDLPSSPLVTLDVSARGSEQRLTVTGEVDCSSAPVLRARLDALFDGRPAEVTVDLGGVTFLDSAGLSVLARAHRRAAEQGARLRVIASGRAVIRPLEITGLWNLLGVEQAEQVHPGAGTAA
jgi:anti-sigma B factor antagonist